MKPKLLVKIALPALVTFINILSLNLSATEKRLKPVSFRKGTVVVSTQQRVFRNGAFHNDAMEVCRYSILVPRFELPASKDQDAMTTYNRKDMVYNKEELEALDLSERPRRPERCQTQFKGATVFPTVGVYEITKEIKNSTLGMSGDTNVVKKESTSKVTFVNASLDVDYMAVDERGYTIPLDGEASEKYNKIRQYFPISGYSSNGYLGETSGATLISIYPEMGRPKCLDDQGNELIVGCSIHVEFLATILLEESKK